MQITNLNRFTSQVSAFTFTPNPDQEDNDQDDIGDTCDQDDDNDGVLDGDDNCVFDSNPDQDDGDGDGAGDTCDTSFDVSTPQGSEILVEGPGANVTFAEILTDGTTSFVAIEVAPDQLPLGFSLCPGCQAFEIVTDADYVPPIDVCLSVPDSLSQTQFLQQRLLHGENGEFIDRTTDHITNDDGSRFVCGRVDSLSPFVLASLAPTAALVSISGRVQNAEGLGLRNALVSLTDSNGNSITTWSSSFGYYRFDGIEVGQTVIVTVGHNRYRFDPRVVSLTGELTDLDITALP